MHTYNIKNAKNVILNTLKFWVKSEVKSYFWGSENENFSTYLHLCIKINSTLASLVYYY